LAKRRSQAEVEYLQEQLMKLNIRIAVLDEGCDVIEVLPDREYVIVAPQGSSGAGVEAFNRMFRTKGVENVTVIGDRIVIEERKKRFQIVREAIDAQCQYCCDGIKPIVVNNDENVYHSPFPAPCRAASIWRRLAPVELVIEAQDGHS
jgi:hypothetical protein